MKTLEYLLLLTLTLVVVVGIVNIYLDAGEATIGNLNYSIIIYVDEESVMVVVDPSASVNEVVNKCLNLLSS